MVILNTAINVNRHSGPIPRIERIEVRGRSYVQDNMAAYSGIVNHRASIFLFCEALMDDTAGVGSFAGKATSSMPSGLPNP